MIVTVLLLGALGVAGIAGTFFVTTRDGYRRQPKEQFALTA
ncbi:hypothetical protein ACDF64_03510 [Agromyces sp. MMS24-JH15]